MSVAKHFLVIATLLLWKNFCFAQNPETDRLKNKLGTLQDTARIDCLNELGRIFSDIQNDTAYYYAHLAYTEAIRLNYIRGMAESCFYLGVIEWNRQRDFAAMEKYFSMAILPLQTLKNDELLGTAFMGMAYAQYVQGQFNRSVQSCENARLIFKRTRDENNLAGLYGLIALCYQESGRYEKALEYARIGLLLDKKINYQEGVFGQLINIGNLFRNVEDYDNALEYYFKALEQSQRLSPTPLQGASRIMKLFSLSDFMALSYARLNIGETYFLMNQPDSAMVYYQKILTDITSSNVNPSLKTHFTLFNQIRVAEVLLVKKDYAGAEKILLAASQHFRQAGDRNQLMRTLLNLGRLYKEKKEPEKSLIYSRELLNISEEAGALKYIRDASQLISEVYKGRNADSAFQYLSRYLNIKDSMDQAQSSKKLAFVKATQEDENKLAQITMLQQEKKIQHQLLNRESLLKNLLLAGILAVVLLGIFLFRNIALKRRAEQIKNERTQIELRQRSTELEMQVLRAQMNPHFIFNSLNSINRFIVHHDHSQASEYLTKFSKLVRLILQNSQASLITLESELESLALYLDLEALRFDNHFSFKISVQPDMDISIYKVPPLILQPYVENAIWHGLMHKEEKGQLEVEVTEENKFLYLKITDDGIGRKLSRELSSRSATRHKSMGLHITAGRIAMLFNAGGDRSTVTINDLVNPDGTAAGTEVIIHLPVVYD